MHVEDCSSSAHHPEEVTIYLPRPCAALRDPLARALRTRGAHICPTFDLRHALNRLPRCGCPYHGEEACTCEYVVWWVAGPDAGTVLLVLHGRDEETWMTLSWEDGSAASVYALILDALAELGAA